MNTIGRLSVVAGVCILALWAMGQEAGRPRNRTLPGPVTDASGMGVDRASCVLQIEPDFNRGTRFDAATLNAMLTSTVLIDPAAKKALGLGPDRWPKVAQVELVAAGNTSVKVIITVGSSTDVKLPEHPASVFLQELIARAKVAVEQKAPRDASADEQRAAIERDLAAAKSRLPQLDLAMRQARTESAGDLYSARNLATSLTIERRTLELSLAGQRARLAAIEKALPAAPSTQPMDGPMRDIVAVRAQMLDQVIALAAEGKKGSLDVLEARLLLAEARLAASAGSQSPSRDGSDRWENEIISLKASIAEGEAKLALLTQRLQQATTAPVSDYNSLQMDEQRTRQRIQELQNQLDQLNRQSRQETRLLVLDGSTPSTWLSR